MYDTVDGIVLDIIVIVALMLLGALKCSNI